MTIEIFPGCGLKPAQMTTHYHLRQADRIGDRYHNNFSRDITARLEGGQAITQMMGDQHAGQFIGMQRSLDINFFARISNTVMKTDDIALCTERGDNEWMLFGLHSNFIFCGFAARLY